MQRLARLGLLGRGALYVVVAILAANIARGSRAEADRQGALRVVGSHWTGRVLLAVVALGFAGYALWRVLEATVTPGDKGWPGRAAALAKAGLYAAFTITTTEYVLTHEAESANRKHMGLAARVMDWPLGRWLVAAVGAGLVVAGGVNVYRAVSGRFRKHLKEHELAKNARPWVFTVAITGLVARGVAFALVGFFVVQAAVTYNARKAQGLDATLRALARAPYGRPLLVAVAVGLTAFGAWCFVEARYRQVLDS
ncbi:MAG TPA: DUF1206 domain-containing protein [Mycobacteriales bacterium]